MPIIHGYPKIIISNLLTCYVMSAKQTHNSRPDRGTLFADVAQVLVAKGHGEDTWKLGGRSVSQRVYLLGKSLHVTSKLRLLAIFVAHLRLVDTFCALDLQGSLNEG